MSKFIQLADGPAIPASSIIKITGPNYIEDWSYVVSYKLRGQRTEYHIVHLSKTFVSTEDKAYDKMKSFIERLNDLL